MAIFFVLGSGNMYDMWVFESTTAFRMVMLGGCIPALIVVILTSMTPENKEFEAAQKSKKKSLK